MQETTFPRHPPRGDLGHARMLVAVPHSVVVGDLPGGDEGGAIVSQELLVICKGQRSEVISSAHPLHQQTADVHRASQYYSNSPSLFVARPITRRLPHPQSREQLNAARARGRTALQQAKTARLNLLTNELIIEWLCQTEERLKPSPSMYSLLKARLSGCTSSRQQCHPVFQVWCF